MEQDETFERGIWLKELVSVWDILHIESACSIWSIENYSLYHVEMNTPRNSLHVSLHR